MYFYIKEPFHRLSFLSLASTHTVPIYTLRGSYPKQPTYFFGKSVVIHSSSYLVLNLSWEFVITSGDLSVLTVSDSITGS